MTVLQPRWGESLEQRLVSIALTEVGVKSSFEGEVEIIIKDLKNIKNVKQCRDGMPNSMQTR